MKSALITALIGAASIVLVAQVREPGTVFILTGDAMTGQYHRQGCPELGKGTSMFLPLANAKARHFQPHEVCILNDGPSIAAPSQPAAAAAPAATSNERASDTYLGLDEENRISLLKAKTQKLWGAYLPPKNNDDYDAARDALRRILNRTKVTVERRDYGVILYAENGESINVQIIEAGWARNGLSTRDPEFQVYEQAQQRATAKSVGMWAPRGGSPSQNRPAPSAGATRPQGGDIRGHCAAEWPRDFSMRAFCEDKQREAEAKIRARQMVGSDRSMIRAECFKDWPEDFAMWNFCEEKQLDALNRLR